MKPNLSSSVIFFQVKDNPTKLQLICSKIQESFKQEKKILITTPNLEGAQYMDQLLWRLPAEGFIPHGIVQSASPLRVAITTLLEQNLNQADLLFNLCPTISPIYSNFQMIYELWDETHPQKRQLSQKKWDDYQSKGLSPINRSTE